MSLATPVGSFSNSSQNAASPGGVSRLSGMTDTQVQSAGANEQGRARLCPVAAPVAAARGPPGLLRADARAVLHLHRAPWGFFDPHARRFLGMGSEIRHISNCREVTQNLPGAGPCESHRRNPGALPLRPPLSARHI